VRRPLGVRGQARSKKAFAWHRVDERYRWDVSGSEVGLIKSIWSVTLYVSDLEKSKRFYEHTLGLDKKYEYSSYAGFECGGVEIGLIPREKVELGKSAPSMQFLVEDVDSAYRALKEKDVEFTVEPHNEPWGGRQAAFLDPDGNTLELTQINWKRYFKAASEGA
jgi:catechol 2,3-dioxygenase-like lactoylglutathione lyase family enzyme